MNGNKQRYIDLLSKKLEEAEELKQSSDESKLIQWQDEVLMLLSNLVLDPE